MHCCGWRDLTERFRPYQTAKRRYYRWVAQGVIDRILEAVSEDLDIEWLAIDATVIRVQAQAAGARIKRGGAQAQALGRSRGSFGTKIHAVVDALGLPIAPMMPTACMTSSMSKAASRSSHHAAIPNISTPTTASLTSNGGVSKASLLSSSNDDASPRVTTKLPPTSSASSNSPASCYGSNN
jgi:transposase